MNLERAPLLVSDAIDPAANVTDAQFNEWYHQVYIKEVSQSKGWRRTSRFDANLNRGGPAGNSSGAPPPRPQMPRWLSLHEFEDGAFNVSAKITSLLGQSKETKQMEKTATKIDISLFKFVRSYGNATAPWGDLQAEKLLP